ncbi:MAG: hypothetical protein DHS20C15_31520 [Planctomycetota bacterium]|nr:MAG: hypothetical protein DHS20C15_31520 [Planctomycetota bacterium]
MSLALSLNISRAAFAAFAGALFALALTACGAPATKHGEWLQLGSMHETIAQQQHHGRISLDELRGTPHLYGVGALAGLQGELALIDSQSVVTTVNDEGMAQPAAEQGEATMFVGQCVESWSRVQHPEAVPAANFDATVKARAEQAGLDMSQPFVFMVEGTFTGVRLHVLNGACPIHARMLDLEIPAAQRPFEWSGAQLKGTLVGVYAEGAVGALTHPATSVHAHLVYDDPSSGARVTAHIERVGVGPGAHFKYPAGLH